MKEPEEFFGNQATGEVFSESARNVKPAYFGGKFANVNGIVNRELSSVALQGKILIKPGKTRWPESKELLALTKVLVLRGMAFRLLGVLKYQPLQEVQYDG